MNYTHKALLLIANVAIAAPLSSGGTELFGAALTPLQIGLATIAVLWVCTIANFMARVYRQDQRYRLASSFRLSAQASLAGSA